MLVRLSETGYKEPAYDGNRDPKCLLEPQTAMTVDSNRKILSTPRHRNETKIGLVVPLVPVVYFEYTFDIIEASVESEHGLGLGLVCCCCAYGTVTLRVMSMENSSEGSERSVQLVRQMWHTPKKRMSMGARGRGASRSRLASHAHPSLFYE